LQLQDGEMGERYVKTADGFGDTVPVRPGPGGYQVMFSYELPYDRKLDLVRKASLPTQAIVILTPEGSIKLKGEGIADGGVRDMQGAQYHLYNAPGLAAGDEFRLNVSGGLGDNSSNGSTALTGVSNTNLLIGLGALGVALIVAGVWLYLRGRPAETGEATTKPAETPDLGSPEAIMDAILALDDLYQEGQLPEEAYLQRRAELKARLKETTGSSGAE